MHVKKKFDIYQLKFASFHSFTNKWGLIFILNRIIFTLEFIRYQDRVNFSQ